MVKEVPKSTGSHQFKVLREAGLICMVPQGRRVMVSLRRDDLEARFPGLLETILIHISGNDARLRVNICYSIYNPLIRLSSTRCRHSCPPTHTSTSCMRRWGARY